MTTATDAPTKNQAPPILDAQIEYPVAAAPPPPPLAAGQHPAAGRAPLTNLTAALVAAQKMCAPVPHDETNTFHKYRYTSSEAIIEEGKRVLGACGLAILPVEQSLDGYQREGENRFEWVSRFLLLHTSGEALAITRRWPVVPEKGRPLDKATAAADTLCLAYFLRDALLMPRVNDDDEVAARNDTRRPAPAPPGQRPPQQQQAPPPQKPAANEQAPARPAELPAAVADQPDAGLGRDQLAAWAEVTKGKGAWATALFEVLGVAGLGQVTQRLWPVLAAAVRYRIRPGDLRPILGSYAGRAVQLSQQDVDIVVAGLAAGPEKKAG